MPFNTTYNSSESFEFPALIRSFGHKFKYKTADSIAMLLAIDFNFNMKELSVLLALTWNNLNSIIVKWVMITDKLDSAGNTMEMSSAFV